MIVLLYIFKERIEKVNSIRENYFDDGTENNSSTIMIDLRITKHLNGPIRNR
jgi:hypothetical protein